MGRGHASRLPSQPRWQGGAWALQSMRNVLGSASLPGPESQNPHLGLLPRSKPCQHPVQHKPHWVQHKPLWHLATPTRIDRIEYIHFQSHEQPHTKTLQLPAAQRGAARRRLPRGQIDECVESWDWRHSHPRGHLSASYVKNGPSAASSIEKNPLAGFSPARSTSQTA